MNDYNFPEKMEFITTIKQELELIEKLLKETEYLISKKIEFSDRDIICFHCGKRLKILKCDCCG